MLGREGLVIFFDELLYNGAGWKNIRKRTGNLSDFELTFREVALEHPFFGSAAAE
jgi:hypothetical protein